MHTVAHHIAGYASELVDENGRNGAMVLTTSRCVRSRHFRRLARLRVERGQGYPLISAGIEGNQRAVETFKKVGGALVGTRASGKASTSRGRAAAARLDQQAAVRPVRQSGDRGTSRTRGRASY